MNIQTRIKKIEQILKTLENITNEYKHYNTDNLEDFYKQNTGDTTHILQIDIVDNSKLKEYFFSCEEA